MPQYTHTTTSLSKTILAGSLPTALSYDVSMLIPLVGAFLARSGNAAAAPAITTFLSVLIYVQLASELPITVDLPREMGTLGELEVELVNSIFEPKLETILEESFQTEKTKQTLIDKFNEYPESALKALIAKHSKKPSENLEVELEEMLESILKYESILNGLLTKVDETPKKTIWEYKFDLELAEYEKNTTTKTLLDSGLKNRLKLQLRNRLKKTLTNRLLAEQKTRLRALISNTETQGEFKAEPTSLPADTTLTVNSSTPLLTDLNQQDYHLMDEKKSNDAANIFEKIKTQYNTLAKIPKNGAISGMFLCACAIVVMLLIKNLLIQLGQNPDVADAAGNFFLPFAFFFLALPFRLVTDFVLLFSGKRTTAMGIALSMLAVTALVQGFGNLSIAYLGLTTGLGLVLTMLGSVIFVHHYFKDINYLGHFLLWDRNDAKQVWKYMKNAVPFIISMLCDVSIPFAISLIAGRLPGNALQIWNVASQFINYNSWLTAAVSQTAGGLIAQFRGQAKINSSYYQIIKTAIVAGLAATLLFQLPLTAFTLSSPAIFAFLAGAAAEDVPTRGLIALTSAYVLLEGLRFTALNVARNIDSSFIPTVISTVCLGAGLLTSFYLSQIPSIAMYGLPMGLAAGALLSTVFICVQFPSLLNKLPSLDAKQPIPDVQEVGIPRSSSSVHRAELAQTTWKKTVSNCWGGISSCCSSLTFRNSNRLTEPLSSMDNNPSPSRGLAAVV